MEVSSHRQLWLECLDLKERGYFYKAQQKLLELLELEQEKSSRVLIELADTLCQQGMYTMAFAQVDSYLVERTDEDDSGAREAICMIRAFCLAHGQAIFQDGLELIQDYEVWIIGEEYRWKFWYLAVGVGLLDGSNKPALDKSLLRTAFIDMVSLEKHAVAEKAASISAFGGDGAFTIDLFRRLASDEKTPSVLKANTLAWLATPYFNKEQNSESRHLLLEARQQLQHVDHAYALAKIELDEAYETYAGQISEIEDAVNHYANICSTLFFFRGLIDSTNRLRDLAHKEKLTQVSLQMSALVEWYAKKSGARVVELRARLDCVNDWNIQSDHGGNAINTAVEVYESLANSDCFPLRQRAASLAAESYAKLKDSERAAFWSQESMKEAENCSRLTQSSAAVLLIRCNFLKLLGPEDARERYMATMKFVRAEIESGNQGIALSMLNLLQVTLAAAPKLFQVDCLEYLLEVNSYIESLQSKQSSKIEQNVSSLELHARAVELIQQSKSTIDFSKEQEAILFIKRAREIRLKRKELSEVAILHGLQGETYQRMAAKFRSSEDHTDLENVRKCLAWASEQYSLALGYWSVYRDSTEIARFNQKQAQVLYESWGIGDAAPDKVLAKVLDGQVCSDRIRSELTTLGGLNAIENKRRVQAVVSTRSGFDIALHVTTYEGMAFQAWEWVQKTKARSLGDLLGSEVLLPKGLLAEIAADKEALEIYEHARNIGEELKKSQSLSISDFMEADEYLDKMRQNAVLKTLVDLREGSPLPLPDLQEELHYLKKSIENRDLVLVDWLFRGDEVWMLTVKDMGEPTLEKLPITVKEIKDWTNSHMQSDNEQEPCIMTDERDEGHPMHELTPLLQPLVHKTLAEDILILSPTGVLHSVPLHAITIVCDGAHIPLIERHPILYAASITTFVQCCRRARDESPRENLTKTFVDAYENLTGYDYESTEQVQVQSLMTELAEETGGEARSEERVLWDDFSSIAENSSMLLFHGHCDLAAEDIKSQGLRLPLLVDEESGESELTSHVPETAVLFSVPSFFDLNLSHAPHITLMACASSAQAITTGDEPLGLITALLCAGATSVLGTMWPVESSTARIFARNFISNWGTAYFSRGEDASDDEDGSDELQGEGENDTEKSHQAGRAKQWLNLAIAVRETVLDLREGVRTKEPYHWAGFVLHGSFFYRDT